MKVRRVLISVVALILGIPMFLVLGGIGWYLLYDRTNGSIVSSGETRDYLLYVPESYDETSPSPLVISMHGTALWPALQRDISGWNSVADEHGFIVVYPGAADPPQRKWEFSLSSGPSDRLDASLEVQYVSDLIDALEGIYNIDTSRIYVDGLSAGGIMALALACRVPDRIAAVAAVAATLPKDWCDGRGPVPLIAFNGTADPLLPYEGGATWAMPEPVESVSTWIDYRARQNQCAAIPIEVREANVLRREYDGCTANLVHYIVEGGGHQWPGGIQFPKWIAGPPVDSIDGTRAIWRFFSEHHLQARQGL